MCVVDGEIYNYVLRREKFEWRGKEEKKYREQLGTLK